MSLPEVFCVHTDRPEDDDLLRQALTLAGFSEGGAWDRGPDRSDRWIIDTPTKYFLPWGRWCHNPLKCFPVVPLEVVLVELATVLAIVDQHADGKFHVPEPWLSIINERDKELAQLRAANEALAHKLDEIDDRNLSLLAKLSAKKSIDFYPEPSPYIRQLAAAELTRQMQEVIDLQGSHNLRSIVMAHVEYELLGKPMHVCGVPIEVEAHTAGVSGWHLVHKVVEPDPIVEDDTSNDPVLLAMIRKDRIEKLENELHDLQDAYSELESERNELNRFKQRADREATEYSPTPAPQPEPEYRQPTKWDVGKNCISSDGKLIREIIGFDHSLSILLDGNGSRSEDVTERLRIIVDDADREWQLKCKMFDAINSAEHLALEEEPGWRWSTYPLAGFELAISSTSGRSATRTLIKRPFRWCKAKVNGTEYDLCQMPNGVFVEDGSVLYPMWGSHDLTDVLFIDGETL